MKHKDIVTIIISMNLGQKWILKRNYMLLLDCFQIPSKIYIKMSPKLDDVSTLYYRKIRSCYPEFI